MELKLWPKKKETPLGKDMDELRTCMQDDAKAHDWNAYADHLQILEEMKSVEEHLQGKCKKDGRNSSELWKTGLVIIGGLAEILLIMNYEKLDYISTKAFTRVIKPKI